MNHVKMKGIFVIMDGLGDLPTASLGGKTPLEAAKTPYLDFLATRGELGYMYPVRVGYAPSSDESIASIFRNDIKNLSRGELEAYGAGLNPKKGDLVLRVDFGTIDSLEKGNILDRRVGRTLSTKEAKKLAHSLNKIDFPYKFKFISTNQHRALLLIRGDFSSKITGNDLTYSNGKAKEVKKIGNCVPLSKDKLSKKTSEVLNEFLKESFHILNNHPVNFNRRKKGLLPANYLLVRSPGTQKPHLVQYKNWISAHYMAMEEGFSYLSGMKNYSFKYPPLRGVDAYKNLWSGLRKAVKNSIKVLKRNKNKAEYCYIHLKETDLPGHDNKPHVKKQMIEYIDKTLFKFLARIAPMKRIKIVVTGDHSTPCKLKEHSSDPVPVLFYNLGIPKQKKFNEKEARLGKLGKIMGKDLLKKVRFVK